MTPKQERFVEEYLVDLNATQAAIRAGYSADTAYSAGERLLRHVEVAKALAIAQEERSVRTEITQDQVLRELAKIGFSDIRRVVRWTGAAAGFDEAKAEETGEVQISVANIVLLTDSDEIDDDTAGAISEISQSPTGALKVKLHDKQTALVNIGKHLGMFREKLDVTLETDLAALIAERRARKLASGN